MVHAFIIGHIDYCNSLLFGVPSVYLLKLQRLQNAAARLISNVPRYTHITLVLCSLHWLPVKFRIDFKILLFTFKAIYGHAPGYLIDLIAIKEQPRYNLRSDIGLILKKCPRSDRWGGGTALLFRDNINVCKLESGSRNSFEFSEYLVCSGSLRIRLVIIYRPPHSTNHDPETVNSFIDEFSEYLDSVILCNDLLCLTDDFNIHVDDHNDPAACRFLDLLESMLLTQHVAEPTHEHGHTLDLVITRESDNLICGRPSPDILFSDHLALDI